jgi:hypothetical protein
MPPLHRAQPVFDRVQTSRATRARIRPTRRLIELDDEPGGDRPLFDPIDDRDRQCHARRATP